MDQGLSPSPSPDTGPTQASITETRLVIGLDYGTTFTGIAYATPSGSKCALDGITVKVDWGSDMRNHEKVPSIISYSPPSDMMEQQWGSSFSPNSVLMVHTKLELEVQKRLGELDMTLQVLDGMRDLDFSRMLSAKGVPAYSHKNPEVIVTDYLTKVYDNLDQTVQNFNEAFRKHTATDIVITVPTDWSYMAMNSTYRALTRAGFNATNFPRLQDVLFITEAEAAALYVARHYSEEKDHEFLKENQYFVLVDAGGGTVDVVTYKVRKLQPLELEQIGKPTGEKCGSIFINREFLKWLRQSLGEVNYRHLDPNLDIDKESFHASESPAMSSLMTQFDEKKQTFTRDSRDTYIDLPEPLADLTISGIVDQGQITIPRDLMEYFFDVCIGEIVKMVKHHMRQVEEHGSQPKDLFLVGGFGSSDYLQLQLEYTLKLYKINLRKPEQSWTAVVQGAVVCGVEKETLRTMQSATTCKYNYAICLDELFSDIAHQDGDKIQSNGIMYAQSQLIWLLNKDDLVLSNTPRKVEREFDIKFPKARQGIIKFPIYRNSSDEKERPTRFKVARAELEQVCTLEIDLGRIVRNSVQDRAWGMETMCQTTLKMTMVQNWKVLRASIEWRGTKISESEVPFLDTKEDSKSGVKA